MKQVSLILAGVAAAAVLAGSVQAQTSTQAQPASGITCNEVRWKAEILQKYPGIEKACVGVVVREGVNYVKVSGKVRRKGNGVVTVRLDHTQSDVAWKPAQGDTVSIEGDAVPALDVVVGQNLRFYMPEDRVAVVDISDAGVKPREVVP